MKIAQIVSTFPPYYGGMGNVVFQTALELTKRGHEVVVYTPQYYDHKEIKPVDAESQEVHSPQIQKHIDHVRRLNPTFQYGNAARLPQLEKELNDYDLVHFHYPFFGTANVVRRWKLANPDKPLVITYHMDPRGLGWQGLVFKAYAKYYSKKLFNVADKIIGSSFDYVESSEAVDHLKKNPKKWMELPFGVDIERFMPRQKRLGLFERHGLDPMLPVILFVGGMDPAHYFKGVPILLETMSYLEYEGFPIQALLVGDGELREEFEMRVKTYGLSKIVKFAGQVSDKELPLYYNLADLFVLPSIHQGEAFGMVLLEAMASGVPVIASDLPGVRTVASDGGLIFQTSSSRDLKEAILGYFLSPEAEQMRWRQRARKMTETKYNWEHIAEKLEGVYSGLVDKG
jgi:glycosyltransferase involved in cell wall biosynthesis